MTKDSNDNRNENRSRASKIRKNANFSIREVNSLISVKKSAKKIPKHFLKVGKTFNSEPRLLNLIVKVAHEHSHYIKNLWNVTFGLWKIRIINGWIISFEWKTSKHHENRELVVTLWFYYESSVDNFFFSVNKYLKNTVKIILWKKFLWLNL